MYTSDLIPWLQDPSHDASLTFCSFLPLPYSALAIQGLLEISQAPFPQISKSLFLPYDRGLPCSVSIQLLSCVPLFVTLWTTAHQASLSITNSQSWLKPMCIESVMPSNHLILFRPLLLLPSIFPSIRVFLVHHIQNSNIPRALTHILPKILFCFIVPKSLSWFIILLTNWHAIYLQA